MIFDTHDIMERRERDGRKALWLSTGYLVSALKISENYLKAECRYKYAKTVPSHRRRQAILPDTGASWRLSLIHI